MAIDLVELFPSAEARSSGPKEAVFAVKQETLAGETKRVIQMIPTSRLTYKRVDVPENSWLRVWLGITEPDWTQSTDGVLFRAGVSDGRTYDELLRQHVDPLHNTNDRRWIPVTIDLSAYAGQQVDIIFIPNNGGAHPPVMQMLRQRARDNFCWIVLANLIKNISGIQGGKLLGSIIYTVRMAEFKGEIKTKGDARKFIRDKTQMKQ